VFKPEAPNGQTQACWSISTCRDRVPAMNSSECLVLEPISKPTFHPGNLRLPSPGRNVPGQSRPPRRVEELLFPVVQSKNGRRGTRDLADYFGTFRISTLLKSVVRRPCRLIAACPANLIKDVAGLARRRKTDKRAARTAPPEARARTAGAAFRRGLTPLNHYWPNI